MTIYPNVKISPWRLGFSLLLLLGLTHCSNLPVEQTVATKPAIANSQAITFSQQVSIAKSLLKQGLTEQANLTLSTINPLTINSKQRIDYHYLKADIFIQAGNILESAQQRTILNTLLFGAKGRLDNQRALIDNLLLLSTQSLSFLKPSYDSPLAGWMELALIIKLYQPIDALDPALDQWRSTYPGHSADSFNLTSLLSEQQSSYLPPSKVGVFLPSQGPVSGVANSIRKGILSASFSLKKRWQPNITFYDTSTASIESLYLKAINDGISVVIGPLEKTNVAKLALLNELPIPIVALNETPQKVSDGVSYFSLSPEKEAAQIASYARISGHKNALILAPDSNFGRRIASHFASAWQKLGGQVMGSQTYPTNQADYSAPIKALLKLDESIRRYKQLQQKLNLNLSFTERRRHDADFVFLIAKPREGRLIKPQLRFHRASSLDVYSTSKIYEGKLNKVANRDLEGVYFCDMPWIIDPKIANDLKPNSLIAKWPSIPLSHQRFFSLGLDAYQIIPHLQRLNGSLSSRFSGETGILSIDKSHSLKRQLSCATFKNGAVKPTRLAPTLDTIQNIQPYKQQATSPRSSVSYATPL